MTTRGRVLLVAALVLLLAGVAVPAGAQDPDGAAAPALELVDRPAWARPVDQLAFAVATTADPAVASVRLEVFSALDSVEELEESADEDVGVRLSVTPPMPLAQLPPGPDGSRLVPLQVSAEPVDDLTTQLAEPGVHPVVISLLGADGGLLDQVRTPLVRLGSEEDGWDAPDLAVLLDLDASPTLEPDGSRSLGGDLDQVAAVAEVLGDHPGLDLTVAAVPDTVDALSTSPEPAAATALEQLAGADVLAAPYVRLPVAELAEHGLEGLVGPLVVRGTALLSDRLGTTPRRGVWAGRLAIGQAGAQILAQLGYDRLVVPAPDAEGDDEEPAPLADSGPRPVLGTDALLGLVADPALSEELAEPLGGAADAAHVALARYLLRPAEDDPADATDDRDDEGRDDRATVLVRPGELPPESVLAGLLDLLDDPAAPVRAGGLDLVDPRPDAPAEAGGEPVVDPVSWSPPEGPDLAEVARRILDVAGRLDSFAAMLGERSPRADDLRLQIATAVAADTEPEGRTAAVGTVEHVLATAFDRILLSGQTDLNLTSRRGTLPVTVENGNDFAVDVLVRLRSDRLDFPDGDVIPVTVGEEDLLRIDVPVVARATGSVPVFVDLLSVDGAVELDSRRLNVRSTAISGVGLVLSLGAVLVLGTWWVRHILATRRAAGSGTDDGSMG